MDQIVVVKMWIVINVVSVRLKVKICQFVQLYYI